MTGVLVFAAGGYRHLEGVFQYSAGVAAEPGFAIERMRFRRPVPLAAAFDRVEAHLAAIGRPRTAFCACELRSPAPFDEAGFAAFNRAYVERLERWGVFRDGANPVARTNVCPPIDPPAAPSFHAFSYTVPDPTAARGGFIVAGSGEVPEGRASYRDHIVRRGDLSPEGLREKMRYVLAEMERRLAALGYAWGDALATNAYTVRDIGPLLAEEVVRRGAAPAGLTWHYARPPVEGLDYEMDVQAPARQGVMEPS
jgi:hypothetical protein